MQRTLQVFNLCSVKFGKVPKGSVLSFQQKLSQDYVINDFSCSNFPRLPLDSAESRFDNNFSICLTQQQQQQASLDALTVTQGVSLDIQVRTVTQSANNMAYATK